ncbi:FGGY-family carbohydrate kinase [Plantactinospora sp. KBS50]|uniref:FGGY-family carbohydrate kinase n=1 Tax=Plantactinospora sp. KBS50 TaxID=2024580 RepID=UPI000BAAC84B|nr:FGGY-family carbohydrate kinase [Plantactinospora sp. KBS50]ASW53783.1 sugar kinase [Plantactinospora sp. KBS50]
MLSDTAVVGIDIGTSSSKGVLVSPDGAVLATAVRRHAVDRPAPGQVEIDGERCWAEAADILRELTRAGDHRIVAVGVSGMGPCVLVTDEHGRPLRPAILYGVDTRAGAQIARLTAELGGAERIRQRCGSALSTQSAGPKLAWLSEHEPAVFARARRFFQPSSWLGWRLTGAYYVDHHSASQCTPLYDAGARSWYRPWADLIAPDLELPPLCWPGEVVGTVTPAAAAQTGLPAGIPVIAGTVDAWSEAVSVGAHRVGDLMLMYGTTMFLINTVTAPLTAPTLWGTVGALPGTRNLAGGMATSGAITGWLAELFGTDDYPALLELAEASGPGAGGLLMLPYFAGERTPVADPDARGVIAGLTLSHTRGDLYRAALEATAYGVRHNVAAIEAAGGPVDRVVAVGGGTQGGLWTQIVSDVTGLEQAIPARTVGASLGAAFFAASAVEPVDIDEWNPIVATRKPRPELRDRYDRLYQHYLRLYPATTPVTHALAAYQQEAYQQEAYRHEVDRHGADRHGADRREAAAR